MRPAPKHTRAKEQTDFPETSELNVVTTDFFCIQGKYACSVGIWTAYYDEGTPLYNIPLESQKIILLDFNGSDSGQAGWKSQQLSPLWDFQPFCKQGGYSSRVRSSAMSHACEISMMARFEATWVSNQLNLGQDSLRVVVSCIINAGLKFMKKKAVEKPYNAIASGIVSANLVLSTCTSQAHIADPSHEYREHATYLKKLSRPNKQKSSKFCTSEVQHWPPLSSDPPRASSLVNMQDHFRCRLKVSPPI